MKTKNNVQKAILKSLAVVFSFVLISITVNAQDFWKSMIAGSGFNDIALAMVETKIEVIPASTDADAFAAYFEVEAENELELEAWMTNETLFNSNSTYLAVEAEETLELENWMIDESIFGNSSFQIIEETESELELEDWMLNEDLFNTNEELEHSMELEDWMTLEEIWIG